LGSVLIPPIGATISLKRTYLAIACLLVCLQATALFCNAQSSSPSQPSDQNKANPPAQQPASAGQTAPPPATPPAGQPTPPADQSQSKEGQGGKAANGKSGNSNDRLFFALPNFLTVENAANVPPLTAGGKFKLVGRSAFDPVQFVWYAALAGISQAENSEPGFGQGAEGYGKRYGAYIADGTIENFMVGAVFPSMLRQDPRFFQSGKGSFFHRTGYAVSRAFVTRTDSGNSQFNYSEIFGSAVAAGISTYSYHPRRTLIGESVNNGVLTLKYAASDRTLKNTASVWGSQVGYDTITFVIKEFWPDIRRKMKKQPQ
jgi:hypothetical protein